MAGHSTAMIERMLQTTGGVQVRMGSKTTWGQLDVVGQEALTGTGPMVVGEAIELRVATTTLPELAIDAFLEADGSRYRVRDLRKENDGAEIVAVLAEAR